MHIFYWMGVDFCFHKNYFTENQTPLLSALLKGKNGIRNEKSKGSLPIKSHQYSLSKMEFSVTESEQNDIHTLKKPNILKIPKVNWFCTLKDLEDSAS